MRRVISTVAPASVALCGHGNHQMMTFFGGGKPGPADEFDDDAALLKKKPFEGSNSNINEEKKSARKSSGKSASSSSSFGNGLFAALGLGSGAGANSVPKDNVPKANNRLSTILARETYEEAIKEDLPPKPRPPRGWTLQHKQGTNYFMLTKNVHIEGASGPELLTVIAKMETKVPDVTYHANTGERAEQQHLVFSVFVQRVYDNNTAETSNSNTQHHKGGLEFTLTSVESEMVLDGLAVHSTEEGLKSAMSLYHQSNQINTIIPIPTAILDDMEKTMKKNKNDDAEPLAEASSSTGAGTSSATAATIKKKRLASNKHTMYRGPYMNELDEELTDEIFDYLDDRGINNAFADFIMAQGHYLEQAEYLNWLELLKVFCKDPAKVAAAATDAKKQ